MQNKQAFTLIELLVVVLIIGILAAVAVPQYQYAVAKAQYKQLVLIGREFQKAQQIYYMANGTYAENLEDLDIELPDIQSKGRKSYHSYGYCFLRIHEEGRSSVSMQCYTSNTAKLPTLTVWLHDQSMSCHASSERMHRICRAETGKSVPDRHGEDGDTYVY